MTDNIDEIASQWLARLDREDASAKDRAAFEAWRAADPRHLAAYARLETAWNRLLRLPVLRAGSKGGGGEPRPFIPASARLRASRVRVYSRAAAAGCLAAALIALLVWPTDDGPSISRRIATEVGGYQRVPLRDGSLVELNTDTELRASITAESRHVELLRGEATFKVVSDPRRPFIVTAGETAMRAVGTVFNVRRHKDAVEIIIVEGKVAVGARATALQSEAKDLQTTPVIRAGQAAIAVRSGLEVRAVTGEEVERELAWQKGMLSFDNSTLSEATAEFNRYNSRQLIVSDPSIAGVRIGGYFRSNNIDGFVRVLESEFAIRAIHERRQVRLTAASALDSNSQAPAN